MKLFLSLIILSAITTTYAMDEKTQQFMNNRPSREALREAQARAAAAAALAEGSSEGAQKIALLNPALHAALPSETGDFTIIQPNPEETESCSYPQTVIVARQVHALLLRWGTKLRNNILGHAPTLIADLKNGTVNTENKVELSHYVDWAVDQIIEQNNYEMLKELINLMSSNNIKLSLEALNNIDAFLTKMHQNKLAEITDLENLKEVASSLGPQIPARK